LSKSSAWIVVAVPAARLKVLYGVDAAGAEGAVLPTYVYIIWW
jgi:hypothetical protein